MFHEDTIAAIATASGPGAISIVRLSGPAALPIADRLFRCATPLPSARAGGTFVYGRIVSPEGIVDEGLLLIFRAPHSYTREDVIEIQCHGGRESVRRVLRLALAAGARPAEPGEFTRRAFLNGRLDLVQAEAVMDLIGAQSDSAAATAVEQLAGRLSEPIGKLYDHVIESAADLEASLDFPEEDFPSDLPVKAASRIQESVASLGALLETWEEGHRLREGALVVITGRPNAGKSTLLNALLKRERAIVSPEPGTTRDAIEESFVLNGIPLRLVDTAGLRTTDCSIEQQGIALARKYIEMADLRIHVIDASVPFSIEDQESLLESKPNQVLVFLNKIDLGLSVTDSNYASYTVCKGSIIRSADLTHLLECMGRLLNQTSTWTPHATLSERHRNLLSQAKSALMAALEQLGSAAPEGLVPAAMHLREAAQYLGQMTGRIFYQDMLDQIFSRFCIGK
jgi:tRNA modification GTPase